MKDQTGRLPQHQRLSDREQDRLFETDTQGRTSLFLAAEAGYLGTVRRMVLSLRADSWKSPGTYNRFGRRGILLRIQDHQGLTAADVAEQSGHKRIASFLRQEVAKFEKLKDERAALFEQDALGRTPLFYIAEKGDKEATERMIFSLRGTGFSPPRLALIETKDQDGLKAADLAERSGHQDVASFLRSEEGRMLFFE